MAKRVKRLTERAVLAELPGREMLDGGTVATPITKEQRALLNNVCARLDRLPAWVLREALKMYLGSVGGAA